MIFNKKIITTIILFGLSLPMLAQVVNPSCTNMGFEEASFNGWCRKIGFFSPGYTKDSGYIVNYDDGIICNNNPILDNVISVVNDNDTIPRLIECNDLRFEIVQKSNTIINGINLDGIKYGNYAVKLGNTCVKRRVDRIEQTFTVGTNNSTFNYNYAVALQDTGICDHISFEGGACDVNNPPNLDNTIIDHQKPYFTIYLEQDGNKIECSEFLIFGDERIFDFDTITIPGVLIKDWEENSLDLLKFVDIGDDVTVVAEVGDCSLGAHYGYAYFEASCGNASNDITISASPKNGCIGDEITFSSTGGFGDYFWTFYDNDNGDVLGTSFDATSDATFSYDKPGHYRVTYGLPDTGTTGECFMNESALYIDIEDCENANEACEACESFRPIPGKTYWLGAWVKEEHDEQVISYASTAIDLVFSDADNQPIGEPVTLKPSGDIIDDWQRIIGEFTIPEETVYFNLNLMNLDASPVYFDDVRVHTLNGNMKSFVYDPENYRLMAELDENNYTTFYEYDNEGGLVRVKKETTEGIMTIQETRSSNPKTHN